MSDEIEMMNDGSGLTWSETWIKALTQPNEQAYREIADDPGASPTRAYKWIAISSLIGIIINLFIGEGGDLFGESIYLLCLVVVAPFLSIFNVMILAGFAQMVAKILGGTGTFTKLVYPYVAYYAPLTIISLTLSSVPILVLLTVPLGLYGLILNVISIKAVNNFGWGKAVISALALPLLAGLVAGFFAILAIVFAANAL